MPTRIAVFPSPTSPPAPKTSDGRTQPVEISQVPRMSSQALYELMASARNVVLVDTRDNESYAAGHIPGALNMLESEVRTRYRELPRNAKIVIYCA
jgi:3-mercaptopyruvate sulfurtransferase SseA